LAGTFQHGDPVNLYGDWLLSIDHPVRGCRLLAGLYCFTPCYVLNIRGQSYRLGKLEKNLQSNLESHGARTCLWIGLESLGAKMTA
jgi:hypothetical protein